MTHPSKQTALDKNIEHAHFVMHRNNKAKHHIKNIDEKLALKKRELDALYHKYLKEKGEVKALEKLSLRALFVRVMGDLQSQLDVERQEYLHAYLQFESCQESIDALVYEKEILT